MIENSGNPIYVKSSSQPTAPIGSLSKRVAKGGFWLFLLKIVQHLFVFIKLIILARVLAPSDFGLMGIALLTLAALATFSQTGFQAALVQKKGDIKSYLDVAWTVSVLRGLILFAILFFGAPCAAHFFKTPEAEPILRVISISLLLNAFTNVGIIYFEKELEFNKQFVYHLSCTFVDFIVVLSAALMLRNIWALVYGYLAGNLTALIVSYLIHPHRPRFNLDLGKIKEMFGFGKWMSASSILVFLLIHGDDIFVGKILGTIALGFYQIAYKISNLPTTEYSNLIATITFPAYSKLQDNLLRLKEAYLNVLQLTAFLSIPIAGLIIIMAPEFTKEFLGKKWMPMVPAMQVLALYGSLRAIGATTGAVFIAVGKPEIRTKIQLAQLIFLAIFIYPLTIRWGIVGTSMAVTAYALVFYLYSVYKVLTIIKSTYKRAIKDIVLPLINTLIMIFSIVIFKHYIFGSIGLISLFLLIIIGVFVYMLVAYFFDLLLNYRIKLLIKEQIGFLSPKSKIR